MIFEKSSCKIQFQQTGFLACKNQFRNRLKIQFVEFDFSKLIFQKSRTDQQGERLFQKIGELPKFLNIVELSQSVSYFFRENIKKISAYHKKNGLDKICMIVGLLGF